MNAETENAYEKITDLISNEAVKLNRDDYATLLTELGNYLKLETEMFRDETGDPS